MPCSSKLRPALRVRSEMPVSSARSGTELPRARAGVSLVLDLLGPPTQRQDLLPVLGRLDSRTLSDHALSPPFRAAQVFYRSHRGPPVRLPDRAPRRFFLRFAACHRRDFPAMRVTAMRR